MSLHTVAIVALSAIVFIPCLSNGQTSFAERHDQPGKVAGATSDGKSINLDANVVLINNVDVPARETGQLQQIFVREGQLVKADEVIGQIDDVLANHALDEANFKFDAAKTKAADMSGINGAVARVEFSNEEFTTKSRLYAHRSESESEFRKAKASKEIAENDLIKAQTEQKLAQVESQIEIVKVNAAKDSIERHKLRSPVDGYVFEINKESKEWVAAGEKVFRIGRMNRLRVVGYVDATAYTPSSIGGRQVTVSARLPGYAQEQIFQGQIVLAKQEQAALKDSFEVWAEVDNRTDQNNFWLLQPGSKVTMTIHLDKNP